ncbi:MAG: leucine-rich repeat protein [Dysgonamonadaceae bacterium]|jgi:hypothetical protein|nr:leucine-rich repeat protein [Dysgonamonadaceae bacterium]
MKKKFFFLFVALSVSLLVKADPVTVSVPAAGTLKTTLEGSYTLTDITELTVTGTIDARDFRTIRDDLSGLEKLDLSGTTVVEYIGDKGTGFNPLSGADTNKTYPANTVPEYSFYVSAIRSILGGEIAPEKKLKLQSIQLPSGITAIGNYALGKQLNLMLTTLDLSGYTQLESLGDYVFYQDSTLVSIILPSSITSIGNSAFQDCAVLASFTVPASTTILGSNLLSGCISISAIDFQAPSSLTAISSGFFAGMANLKKVVIPASIKTLPVNAFIYNTNAYFTGDSIGVDPANTVFSSVDGILYNKAQDTLLVCPAGLSAPSILSTVKDIGDAAFRYGALTRINIPASVQTIGTNAFSNSKIATLSFDDNSALETIKNQAFYRDTFLVAVNLPASLKTIGNEVFNGDLTLKTIALPAGITTIGNTVFAYSSLVSADFSALTNLSSWGTSTFQRCDSLVSVKLPPNYETIPGNTFNACISLRSIEIPASVKTIGASAFSSSKLETVTLPEGLETIGATAFSITPLKSVFIPKSVTTLTMGSGSPFNRIPGRITVDVENPNYSSIDGILYNKDTTVLIEAPTFLSGAFVVPKTVTTIETYAFQFDSLLTSIELPASLLETQPIKNYAFAGCTALERIIVKSQTPPTFTTNQYPFGSMSQTTCTLYVPKGTVDAYHAANRWKDFTSIKEAGLFYDLGYGYPSKISPNGKYLTGSLSTLWENKENGDNTLITIPLGEGTQDVNDDGVVTANFADNTYLVNSSPIISGGVYKDGTWYSLGLGRYGTTTGSTEAGSHVNAITADGWVFGMSNEKNNVAKVIPMVWKPDETGQYTDTLVYSFPEDNLPVVDRTQGTRFYDASADGAIACGWAVQASTFGGRQSIVWTSPTEYKIIAPETIGEAHDVSPSGKFVALTTARKAALYYVEKDSLVVFGPDETVASAVSDDGTVVGFRNTVAGGRKGFIWSDKLGYIELKDFIEKYMPEITLSEDFRFSNDESDFYMDVPMTISGDGLVIAGWRGAGVIRKTWVITLPAPLDLISRPFALTAYADPQTRNVVELNWSAPEEIGTHDLDFYGVYRNDLLIAQIESDQTSYTDNDAPSGYVSYSISAIYDYDANTSTFRESNKSEPVQVAIVDNYDLPFYDGFDNGNYGTNYWEVSPSAIAGGWTYARSYKSALGNSASFVTVGDKSTYSHTLATKPLDATGQTTVIASFVYEINAVAGLLVGIKDTVHFEVADIQGTEWTTVKSYVLSSVHAWETESLDITDLVKETVFKARFRAVSGANRNYMSFNVDEFAIAIAPSIAPSGVKAERKATSSDVEIVWQDPSGSYGLTYAQSPKRSTTLGNNGHPFIAVNKFDPADLTAYKDLYLTSISAYINAKGRSAIADTKLKLAVFAGDNRLVTQEIESFEGDAWNTFALNTPLQITADAALSFGIEVAEHDSLSFPMASDNIQGITGKSDAFSEDGGITWQTLADWNYPYSWLIIGNVRETAADSERAPDILGYEVYRNDEKINTGLTFRQTFVDTTLSGTEEAACYKVKTCAVFGGISGFSDEGCLSIIDAIALVPAENIAIYPNPAGEWIQVDGDFSTLTFFDLNGRKVLEAKESPVKIKSLNVGTYVVEITTANGSRVRSKVIVRK